MGQHFVIDKLIPFRGLHHFVEHEDPPQKIIFKDQHGLKRRAAPVDQAIHANAGLKFRM